VTDDDEPIPYSDAAVADLMAEYGKEVKSLVRLRLRNDPNVDDVLNQSWLELIRAWKRRGEIRTPRKLLFHIAQQRTTDRIRELGRRPEQVDSDALTASREFVSALAVRVDVHAALAELPVRQRQALVFVCGYRLTYQAAGDLMGCSENAVGNLLRLGKAAMQTSPHLAGYQVTLPPEVQK
jgi:RNA polymerase sigma factor (sigma-70 family)